MNEPSPASYPILDVPSLPGVLSKLPQVRDLLGGRPATWRVREIGDGNLNLVFIVEGSHGTCCVKQALPYLRAAGPSWPMSPDRAFFETAYYRAVAPFVGRRIPRIYHSDPQLHCTVMERLTRHVILREGLIAGRRFPRIGRDLGEYVARASFFTSDLAVPFERKMDGVALFARNQQLIRITVDLVFTDPYFANPRNRHTSPELDAIAADLRRDGPLKAAAGRWAHKFLSEAQALIHGDLHSGSVMVTEHDSRVIDPEFAFYGPIGFDLGAFFGNLLLGWYAQPGHATRSDDRRAYADWILEQAGDFWHHFRECFLALWTEHGQGDAFAAAVRHSREDEAAFERARGAFVDGLFADMLGFAACKMIRRILGFAHVSDFERIEDPALRARCEARALALARRLLTESQHFGQLEDVLDAVPKVALEGGMFGVCPQ